MGGGALKLSLIQRIVVIIVFFLIVMIKDIIDQYTNKTNGFFNRSCKEQHSLPELKLSNLHDFKLSTSQGCF